MNHCGAKQVTVNESNNNLLNLQYLFKYVGSFRHKTLLLCVRVRMWLRLGHFSLADEQ